MCGGLKNRCRFLSPGIVHGATAAAVRQKTDAFPKRQEKYGSARSCLRTVGFCTGDIAGELGLHVEVPELRADMTEEDAAAAAAQLAHELRRAEESRDAAKQNPRHEKASRAAEERVRRHEQAAEGQPRRHLPAARQGAAPGSRARSGRARKKSRIMQEITAAYARGNLHALLQLELEWLGGPSGDAARLSLEKLRAYTELLKQQATELADEVQSLRLHPRYAAVIVEGPFGFPVVIDGPREVERLDTIVAQVRSALEHLSSHDALEEVRGAIREYRDSEKRQTLAERRRR
jgi:hypothetical protein